GLRGCVAARRARAAGWQAADHRFSGAKHAFRGQRMGRARTGLAPRTIKLVHVVLHRAFGQAKIWRIVRANPAERPKPAPAAIQEGVMLPPDQAAALLERLHGKQPLYLLVSLALATGMRRNEMLGLRWRDVDLDVGRLTIEQSLEETAAYGIRVK